MSRISRRASCPCGSGRKYKKCCVRLEGLPLHPDIVGLLNGMEPETKAQMVDFAAAEMARIEKKTCNSNEDRMQARLMARMMLERYEAMRPDSVAGLVAALERMWGKDLCAGLGGKGWLGHIVSRVRDALGRRQET